MLKKITLAALILTLIVAPLSAAPMTGDEIIAKHLAMTGGEAAMRAIKNVSMSGSMFAQGMTLDMKMQVAVPDKALVEVSMNKVVMQTAGVNGNNAWYGTPMGKYLLSGDMKEKSLKQADIFPLLDYKKRGATAKFIGNGLVKGTKTLEVQFVEKNNDTTEYYFADSTFMILKKKDGASTSLLSDYKKVGGIMMPYKMNQQGEMGSAMISIDTIYVNATIPDSVFAVPKDAKPYEELQKLMQQMRQPAAGAAGHDSTAAKKDTTAGKK